ncbi:PKD domain-containing protein [Methanoculleus sp. UBA430]|uniref:PKD domain-containing protein n=1 Tax=Methanoculleus sp. UBA430 TaxID=1915511 RepID=UPI0025E8604C|nr:PKD domain-containing protein [Methanoculleus sp. UBA430]
MKNRLTAITRLRILHALIIVLLVVPSSASAISDDTLFALQETNSEFKKILDASSSTGNSDFPGSDKSNLTEGQQKLSTDLLQLLDSAFLPEVMTPEKHKAEMMNLQQLSSADGSGSGVLFQESSESVYVYIFMKPGFPTDIIDPFAVTVTDRDEENSLAVAWVPVSKLEGLAALDSVRSIRTVMPPILNRGSVTTEGDAILRADQVRSQYGFRGNGVCVGIISDGVDHIASSQASGDLPGDVRVLSNSKGGDEGTAMLEIVHDMVPDADLVFHDCGANRLAFNNGIDALIASGCTVVCDDISWIGEPFFEDGIVASHIESVLAANNIIYISSAGNAATKHYQGTYYNGWDNCHDFSEGSDPTYQELYVNIPPEGQVRVVLQWNDMFGSSGNDYDLYLCDYATGAVVASGTTAQNGDDDPLEALAYTNTQSIAEDYAILVQNYQGAASSRILEVFIYPAGGTYVYTDNIQPSDSIFGHPAVQDVISVGAIAANDPGHDVIEPFSSQGPVTISYPSAESRHKPDIAGIDGVSITGAGGFSKPFYGTSAAAPHIAGMVAQIWGAYPAKTSAQIRTMLYTTAVDLGTPGWDTMFGYGRADALEMYLAGGGVSIPPVANFTADITSGTAPLAVQFSDTSTGEPTAWNWTFGDGATSTEQHPIHTYTAAGIYTVTLTATNATGSDTLSRERHITVLDAMTIGLGDAGAAKGQTTQALLTIRNASAIGGGSLNLTYDPAIVTVDAINGASPWHLTSNIDTANGKARIVYFTTYGQSGDVPICTVTLKATGEPGDISPLNITVDELIDDGGKDLSFAALPVHGEFQVLYPDTPDPIRYRDANGLYKGILSGNTLYFGEENLNLTRLGGAQRLVHYSNISAGTVDATLNVPDCHSFNVVAGGSPITGRYYAWGDDGLINGRPWVEIRQPITGLDVLLGGTNTSVGGTSLTCNAILDVAMENNLEGLYATPAVIFMDIEITTPGGGKLTQFGATDLSGIPIEASRVYIRGISLSGADPGSYTAKAVWPSASDFAGKGYDSNVVTFEIASTTSLANFTANTTTGIVLLTVQFTDTSTGDPTAWNWSFGDGATSTEQHPVHTYTAPGTYTVNLTVSAASGSDTLSRPGYITVMVKGDFGGDGIVDIGDVSRVAYMVVGKAAPDPAADFNENGAVDIGDAAKIAYYYVEKIPAL